MQVMSWTEVLRRLGMGIVVDVVRGAQRHDVPGQAAKISYYFFLSLFPCVLIVFSLTGFLGGDAAFSAIAAASREAVPDYAWQFVEAAIREITERRRPGILSAGILLTLWSASSGVASVATALNKIFALEEERPWWQRRLIAISILAVGVVLIVIVAAALVRSVDWLRDTGLAEAWRIGRWPLAGLALTATFWLAYSFLPAHRSRAADEQMTVGAIAAAAMWAGATALLTLYYENVGRLGRAYGFIGAIIALMIWFYISSFVVLIGGELASALVRRHRAPHLPPAPARASRRTVPT